MQGVRQERQGVESGTRDDTCVGIRAEVSKLGFERCKFVKLFRDFQVEERGYVTVGRCKPAWN